MFVIQDQYSINQFASKEWNDWVLENWRQNKGDVAVTCHCFDISGNDITEPNTGDGNKHVFLTSVCHGAPWVRNTILPNGAIFRAPVNGTAEDITNALNDTTKIQQTIHPVSGQTQYLVNVIIPSYDYTETKWRR